MNNPSPKVIIVGAGIVGATASLYLARAGARVTVLEREGAAAAGVTGKAFGWVGNSNTLPSEDRDLFVLCQEGLTAHERLARDLPGAVVKTSRGALLWRESAEETARLAQELRAEGSAATLLDRRALARLEPDLATAPDQVLHAPADFAVEPAVLTAALLRAAQDAGADVRFRETVTEIVTQNGRVTGLRTEDRLHSCDVALLANGTAAPALAAPLEVAVPVAPSPVTLLRFAPVACRLGCILQSHELEVRQGADGGLVAAEWYPEEGEAGFADLGAVTRATIQRYFALDQAPDVQFIVAGHRPMPSNGKPICKFAENLEGLYIAVAHPGIILAPLLAQRASGEILGNGASHREA